MQGDQLFTRLVTLRVNVARGLFVVIIVTSIYSQISEFEIIYKTFLVSEIERLYSLLTDPAEHSMLLDIHGARLEWKFIK